MLFLAPLLLTLPLLTSSLPHIPRSAASDTLISDIGAINAGVLQLTKDTIAYNGGIVQATPITLDTTTIHLANRKGYADANLSPLLDSADSNAIVQYTVNTVGNSIPNGIVALKGKKPQFQASGLDPVILAGLQLLLNDHDTFSAALEGKLSADSIPAGTAVVAEIHNAIQDGINYYSA